MVFRFLAAALEYMSAEVLELSGNSARDHKKSNITPRHIFYALAHDEELNSAFFKLKSGNLTNVGCMKDARPCNV